MCRLSCRLYRARLIFMVLAIGAGGNAQAERLPGPLVETGWLAQNLSEVVLLDVRIDTERFKTRKRAGAAVQPCGVGWKSASSIIFSGHIPGAKMIPWTKVRGESKTGERKLQAMLPSKNAFEKLMQRSGVNNDSAVVITSNGENYQDVMLAARLYWTFKYYGHDDIALLNGGTRKWALEKRKIEYGKSKRKKGKFKVKAERRELLATAEDVSQAIKDHGIQLVDNRPLDHYLGLTYNKALGSRNSKGHVPTAKNWPLTTVVDSSGVATFHSIGELRKVGELLGVDVGKPAITYDWSGTMASLGWFVIHELFGNRNARVYDGSMHEWGQVPDHSMVSMRVE